MALMMFILGSLLGLVGAAFQLVFGFDATTALNTYAFFALGMPMATLLATPRDRRG